MHSHEKMVLTGQLVNVWSVSHAHLCHGCADSSARKAPEQRLHGVSAYWVTANLQQIVTPSAVIWSTRSTPGAVGAGLIVERWLFGDAKTIFTELVRWSFKFLSPASILNHWVIRCDGLWVRDSDDIRYRTDSRVLNNTGWDGLSAGEISLEYGAMRLVGETWMHPVVSVFWYIELSVFV